MTASPQLNRRSLLVSAAAIGGGLSLGLRIPFGLAGAQAADSVPEVNAWVVIRPDDTAVIRIARSEMGQGTLTGLAQLVAEELECNWSKVTTEYPTPGENLTRKRVWGNFSTGGSRGIRDSHEYVRQGGAAARNSPVFGGQVKSFDAVKVEGMRGVKKVVPVGETAGAVVADNFWNAKTALAALPIVWDEGPNAKVSSPTIADMLKEGLDAEQAFVGNKAGDAKAALAGAAKVVEAVYSYPYQSHSPMEPMNATALYTPEKCEVWCPTQSAEGALAAVAEAS